MSCNVAVIGNYGTGKTSLIRRIVEDRFNQDEQTTIAIEYSTKTFTQPMMKLHFWDTAGQERFRSLIGQYVKKADIILLVFALNDLDSFLALNYWMGYLRDNVPTPSQAHIILVGNKNDEPRQVSDTQITEWVQEKPVRFVRDVSAKTASNISALCNDLRNSAAISVSVQQNNLLHFNQPTTPPEPKRCCH